MITIFLIATIAGICLRMIAFFDKDFLNFGDESILGHLIKHFDITGIIVGVIGILVGFLIYYVVEQSDEEKQSDLTEHLITLSKITGTIKASISDLRVVSSLKMRLGAVREITDHARLKNNKLFILSYAPVYGQYFMHNLGVICEQNGILTDESLNQLTEKQLAEYLEKFKGERKLNVESLINFVSTDSQHEKLHMAILKNSLMNVVMPPRLEKFISTRILNDKRVIMISQHADKKMQEHMIDGKNWHNVYIEYGKPGKMNLGPDECRNEFIKKRSYRDRECLDTLIARNAKINYLDYVPFQFFVSLDNESNHEESMGMLIFTNYYAVGKNQSVISFTTRSHELCASLAKMHEMLVSAQHEKDKEINYIKKLFHTSNLNKIHFILRQIHHPELKEEGEHTAVVPVADNQGKDSLNAILSKNELNISEQIFYTIENTKFIFDNRLPANGDIYFSIGLFFNALTQEFYQQTVVKGALFILEDGSMDANGKETKPKVIKLATGSGNNSEFEYNATLQRLHGEQSDYVIVSRNRIHNRLVYICGGMTEFGTKHLHYCIKEEFCKTIFQTAGNETPFLLVFQVSSVERETEKLFFSYINTSNIIKVPINKIPQDGANASNDPII